MTAFIRCCLATRATAASASAASGVPFCSEIRGKCRQEWCQCTVTSTTTTTTKHSTTTVECEWTRVLPATGRASQPSVVLLLPLLIVVVVVVKKSGLGRDPRHRKYTPTLSLLLLPDSAGELLLAKQKTVCSPLCDFFWWWWWWWCLLFSDSTSSFSSTGRAIW